MIIGLAPMDGFTDCAMREITQEIFDTQKTSATLYLRTEFMTADGYCAKPEAVIRHLMTTPNQKNLIAQIHGGNLKNLLKTIKDINKKYANNFVGVELNLGCPARNIMKSGAGSELLKDKENALTIIKALSEASKLPFSIKTRTGLNQEDKQNQMDFLLKASEYCSMITIHGRTVKQGYTGDADWDFIYKLKEKISAPCKVIGNGGIHSYTEAKEKLGNLDGVMIGQAAIGNPRIFIDPAIDEVQTFRQNVSLIEQNVSLGEKCETILHHLDLMLAHNSDRPEEKTIIEFRKHLFQYIKGIPDSREFKVKMSEIKDHATLKREIQKFFEEKKEQLIQHAPG